MKRSYLERLKVKIGQLASLKSIVIETVALNSAVSKSHLLSVIVCKTTVFTTQTKKSWLTHFKKMQINDNEIWVKISCLLRLHSVYWRETQYMKSLWGCDQFSGVMMKPWLYNTFFPKYFIEIFKSFRRFENWNIKIEGRRDERGGGGIKIIYKNFTLIMVVV